MFHYISMGWTIKSTHFFGRDRWVAAGRAISMRLQLCLSCHFLKRQTLGVSANANYLNEADVREEKYIFCRTWRQQHSWKIQKILTIYTTEASTDANPTTTVNSTSSIRYLNHPKDLYSFLRCFCNGMGSWIVGWVECWTKWEITLNDNGNFIVRSVD